MNTDDEFDVERFAEGALFRLNRPGKHNALTRPMLDGLAATIAELERERKRVLLISGAGAAAFCAGTDLAEAQGMAPAARLDKSKMARDLFAQLSRSRVLSIALLNGLAYGGGLELAMACTLRMAHPHVRLSLPEIKLGLLPAYGGTQFLVALVGRARATELMLTGRAIDIDEASRVGLVHRVVPASESIEAAGRTWATELAALSHGAIDGIRECIAVADDAVTDAGLAVEDAVVRRLFNAADAAEGIAAFLQKRPARFNQG